MSLYTLGLNHTTAPIEVRERVAFSPDALTDALRDLTGAQRVKEAAILSTCNRTEVYFHGSEPGSVAQWLAGFHNLAPARHRTLRLHAAARQGGGARLPRGQRHGLDGAGRAADPGPDEAGGALGGIRRLAGPGAEPPVPAHLRGRQGRAHADRHRQRVDFDGRRGGEAGRAHLPVDHRAAAAADRCRRNDRTRGDAFRGASSRSP